MTGLLTVLAFVAVFVWLGFTAHDFDGRTQRRLFAMILVLVIISFMGIIFFWRGEIYA